MMNDLETHEPGGVPSPIPSLDASQPEWLQFLAGDEWTALCDILAGARAEGVDVLIGGALALAAYMPLQRQTKDVDFYVMPQERDRLIAVLTAAGFRDLYEDAPYDRQWIYRGIRGTSIADVIWRFANHKTDVDEDWFRFSHTRNFDRHEVHIVPPEELLWAKLFVLQRDRCDWPDILNLLYYEGTNLDWQRLYARVGQDSRLLEALLLVFSWLCPDNPLSPPASNKLTDLPACKFDRARMLDSRGWFLPQRSC